MPPKIPATGLNIENWPYRSNSSHLENVLITSSEFILWRIRRPLSACVWNVYVVK
jgi:hypothetical protein